MKRTLFTRILIAGSFLALVLSCLRGKESPEELQIRTLHERVNNLQELLNPEFLDSVYLVHDVMGTNSLRLDSVARQVLADPVFLRARRDYQDAFHVMDTCMKSCSGLQKEISFIESDLEELEQAFLNEEISRQEFRDRFREEVNLMDGITERVYRGYRTSREQMEVHRRLQPLLEPYLRMHTDSLPSLP